ncbi:sulfur carrier protein ThiS [Hoyosella rhizosphaerae]|uniref:Thiamine biosynthesis protein ThiS n=1 Tax=Hoyosella rhizosphaerae TaxID=1755582 RepID=A0A916U8B6_9ACTN|nr:sulfur carrier protein ThiS [Hoyosella rhizosphaerae]MBN4927762.1 sulfur carrier protein ThiS [Hoyosella rhizosphaerae]GGC61723.1 thiamine biosynthesis protein ThiS [Hoyosella rhizosphaerae]
MTPVLREIQINGEWREFVPGSTLAELLDQLGLQPKGLAIAVAGEVVPKDEWSSTSVDPSLRIEIVTAVQGG